MPWNEHHFPLAMKNLRSPVREKAIDIANALLAEGMDEGRVIRIAIAQAKKWALHSSDGAGAPFSDAAKRN